MWKRPDDPVPGQPLPNAVEPPRPGSPPPPLQQQPPQQQAPRSGGAPARLGPSLSFEGTLAGEEDLLVDGRFRGEISCPQYQVTVGSSGHVEGEVRASAIVVEGEVRGNLTATQQVLVRASGSVHGDIRAPRVALDQGCRFKGAIDMEPNGRSLEATERRDSRRETPEARQEGRREEGQGRREEGRKEREGKGGAVAAAPPVVS